MLLERRALPATGAVEHLVGMQAQEPQAPYLGLWSRVADFDPADLSDLIAGRRVVRGALMRATLHLVTTEDWLRIRPLVQPVLARGLRGSPFGKELDGVDLAELLAHGRRLLAERPLTRAELAPLLAERWPSADATALAHAVSYLEPIVQVPPRALWRRGGQARWTTAEAWIDGHADIDGRADIDRGDGIEALILRYLAAFGPASVADIQAWSGLTRLAAVTDRLRIGLRLLRDEHGRELLDLPDAPLPDPATPAPPRFLPPFDNALLAHADRARIIAPDQREIVYRDRLMRTFLIDGFVAGTWQLERATLHLWPLGSLSRSERTALEDEARRVLSFLAPDEERAEAQIHPPGS